MQTSVLIEKAEFTVAVSCLFAAKSKSHACRMAECKLNVHTIQLDKICLMNENGMTNDFRLKRPVYVRWTAASPSEYTGYYHVRGQLRLELAPESGGDASDLTGGGYRLPSSSLDEITVWVIPTDAGPLFTQVLSQSLAWHTEESPSLVAAAAV